MHDTRLNNNALLALISNAATAAPYFQKSALIMEGAKDWLASQEAQDQARILWPGE